MQVRDINAISPSTNLMDSKCTFFEFENTNKTFFVQCNNNCIPIFLI